MKYCCRYRSPQKTIVTFEKLVSWGKAGWANFTSYSLQLAGQRVTKKKDELKLLSIFFFFLCFRQHFESSHLIKLSLKCNNYSRYWFRLIWTLLCHLCRISGRRVRVRCVSLTDVDWAPTQMRIPSGAVVQMMCLIFSGKQEEEADIYSWVYCSWVLVRRNGRLL